MKIQIGKTYSIAGHYTQVESAYDVPGLNRIDWGKCWFECTPETQEDIEWMERFQESDEGQFDEWPDSFENVGGQGKGLDFTFEDKEVDEDEVDAMLPEGVEDLWELEWDGEDTFYSARCGSEWEEE